MSATSDEQHLCASAALAERGTGLVFDVLLWREPARAFALRYAGQVVGYATAGICDLPHPQVGPNAFELKRFYLMKARQNGGVGGRLWGEVLDWMMRQDPDDLWIGVWSENHGAQRFYARHGFEKVGEYGFRVGQTVDHEFILRRPTHRNSN